MLKKTVTILAGLLLISYYGFAQMSDEEKQLKKKLQPVIDNYFEKWDDKWSADQYVSETAKISYFKKSDYGDDRIEAWGSFTVLRTMIFKTKVNVQFKAVIKISGDALVISKLCYIDKSVNQEECVDPSDWDEDE